MKKHFILLESPLKRDMIQLLMLLFLYWTKPGCTVGNWWDVFDFCFWFLFGKCDSSLGSLKNWPRKKKRCRSSKFKVWRGQMIQYLLFTFSRAPGICSRNLVGVFSLLLPRVWKRELKTLCLCICTCSCYLYTIVLLLQRCAVLWQPQLAQPSRDRLVLHGNAYTHTCMYADDGT